MLKEDIIEWLLVYGSDRWVEASKLMERFSTRVRPHSGYVIYKWDDVAECYVYKLTSLAINSINKVHEVPQS